MPKALSFEEPEINLAASMEETKSLPEPDTPFRIALLGDWSGQTERTLSTNESQLSEPHPIQVDRDNFDEVMRNLGVEVRLDFDGANSSPLTLQFNELDDFLPDRIYERLELFDVLKQTRQRLSNPATFADAAAEVRGWSKIKTDHRPRESTQKESASIPGLIMLRDSDLLDQILGDAEGESQSVRQSTSSEASDDLRSMLQSIVRPHLVPSEDPQQTELVIAVDEATSGLMRSILHHPDFQAVESAWRALYFLVSRLETGTELKLYLLNISKAELVTDLLPIEGESKSKLDKIFVEQSIETQGSEFWAALAGNYTFDQTLEDIEMLNRLSQLAKKAGAPFLAAASPQILGCESLATTPDPDDWQPSSTPEESQAWAALRQKREASFVGLALPGFLLRLPYGKDTEPTELFDFEEIAGEPKHEGYLWGNPVFACVYLLAQAFSTEGWEMRPGILQDIEGLPLHVYGNGGESQVKPCAEVLLSLRAAETILKRGLMPLLSFKGSDAIRLAMFQSLADPVTSLSGHWT